MYDPGVPALNYTTKIPADKTLGEVQRMLGKAGASAVALLYDEGVVAGMTFRINTGAGPRDFRLPVDVDAMAALLAKGRPAGGMSLAVYRSREHAERVAWRVAKDWLAAQITLIDAHLATLEQVMLPYLLVAPERTLFEEYRDRGMAITAG